MAFNKEDLLQRFCGPRAVVVCIGLIVMQPDLVRTWTCADNAAILCCRGSREKWLAVGAAAGVEVLDCANRIRFLPVARITGFSIRIRI